MCGLVPWATKLYLFTNLWEYIKWYTEKRAPAWSLPLSLSYKTCCGSATFNVCRWGLEFFTLDRINNGYFFYATSAWSDATKIMYIVYRHTHKQFGYHTIKIIKPTQENFTGVVFSLQHSFFVLFFKSTQMSINPGCTHRCIHRQEKTNEEK